MHHLDGHDATLPADTGNGVGVIARCGEDTGHLGAMAILIVKGMVVGEVVPAVDIVDEPVGIIIEPVASNFTGVDPEAIEEVGMVEVEATIDDGDGHGNRTGDQVPGGGELDLGCPPLLGELWVEGGGGCGTGEVVGFDILDGGVAFEEAEGLFDGEGALPLQAVEPIEASLVEGGVQGRGRLGEGGGKEGFGTGDTDCLECLSELREGTEASLAIGEGHPRFELEDQGIGSVAGYLAARSINDCRLLRELRHRCR